MELVILGCLSLAMWIIEMSASQRICSGCSKESDKKGAEEDLNMK